MLVTVFKLRVLWCTFKGDEKELQEIPDAANGEEEKECNGWGGSYMILLILLGFIGGIIVEKH